MLGSAGFSQLAWEDKTGVSTAFLEGMVGDPPQGIGIHVIMRDAKTKIPNLLRNLKGGRVCVVQAVLKKPS